MFPNEYFTFYNPDKTNNHMISLNTRRSVCCNEYTVRCSGSGPADPMPLCWLLGCPLLAPSSRYARSGPILTVPLGESSVEPQGTSICAAHFQGPFGDNGHFCLSSSGPGSEGRGHSLMAAVATWQPRQMFVCKL